MRRGYFVEGLGATQFAEPGAEERLRSEREPPKEPFCALLASTDPASPYGASVPWPERDGVRFARSVGTHVILVDGALVAYVGRAGSSLTTVLPELPAARRAALDAIARALAAEVDSGRRRALLLVDVDGGAAASSELASALVSHGFTPSARGLLRRPSLEARGRVTLARKGP